MKFAAFPSLLLVIVLSSGYAAPPKAPPANVTVAQPQQIQWQASVRATGSLVAEQSVNIAPDVPGRVTHIFFHSGQKVEKGQPLVQLFPDILKAQLTQAKAALELSRNTFERFKNLIKRKAASQSQFDEAAANFAQAKATVARIHAELEQTLIRAPFSGILGIRHVSIGDFLTAGKAIVSLADTNPMYVDFTVPEVFSRKITPGQRVSISSNAYGKKLFSGEVIASDARININTRTLEVRASIPNEQGILIPGSFVIVKLFVGEKHAVLQVPQTAIVYSQQGNFVYVVRKNKAEKVNVSLGERGAKNIIVLKGLTSEDSVVTTGQQRLFPGAAVSIAK